VHGLSGANFLATALACRDISVESISLYFRQVQVRGNAFCSDYLFAPAGFININKDDGDEKILDYIKSQHTDQVPVPGQSVGADYCIRLYPAGFKLYVVVYIW